MYTHDKRIILQKKNSFLQRLKERSNETVHKRLFYLKVRESRFKAVKIIKDLSIIF